MPTVIALDISLSMQRNIPGRTDLTYHQLACKGISQYLDTMQSSQKMEYIALATYSTRTEILVDFTRDLEMIRVLLRKIEHCDKTNFEGALKLASETLSSIWGKQNPSQVLIFTDCGLGFGPNSVRKCTTRFLTCAPESNEFDWVDNLRNFKVHIVCMGVTSDSYFTEALTAYQKLMEILKIKANFYLPKPKEEPQEENSKTSGGKSNSSELGRTAMTELVERICEQNYKPFEAVLKCGGYGKLESKILMWPVPGPHISTDEITGQQVTRNITKHLEVCGFLALSDIGSPSSLSRHLITPKPRIDPTNHPTKKGSKSPKREVAPPQPMTDYEKLEQDIKMHYSMANKQDEDPDESHKNAILAEASKENVCVLLHGALKLENLAAVVLLNENWYGFIYTYADSKKKSNLILSILPPGNNNIPWLGDFRSFGLQDDIIPGDNAVFPVKSEKRSYSQNSVVWIKAQSLQSDVQKVLRHARKLPEKTVQFYKEFNRIRNAALAIGFCELLDTLAQVFEREATILPPTSNPDCALQLKHAAIHLRLGIGHKANIIALPTKYNT